MLQFLQPMLSLLPKRKWVRDSATDHCYECCIKIKSGLFSTNKHHCRLCGNIVCDKCSGSTYKKHRVCDSCNKLINKAEINTNLFNENDSDSDSEEKEELSPYNTPMLKYKEFSQDTMDEMDIIDYISIDDINYNTNNIHSSFNNNYINSFNNNYNPFDIMIDDHYNEYEYNKREYNIRKYLVYGFVRKCWKTLLQFNSNKLMKEFPCKYIMDLLINIISISDSFNEYYTNLNIIICNKPIYHLKSYRNVSIIERRKEWNTQCYHTFGNDIITRGSKKIWKFKICGYNNNSQKPCILIGIIETSKIKNFVNNYDGSFNDEWNKGYALYTADWNIYHKDTKGIPFTDNFIRLNITPNDVIAMEVDLTQKYVLNYNNKNISKSLMSLKEYKSKSQCGTLKYIFNGKTDIFKNDGIAFNNIDINKTYQLAIGMYLKDKLAMFQIL